MKLSLKNKFLVPTATAILICLVTMSVISFVKSKTALKKTITGQAEYISSSISKQVGNWIGERKDDVANFSNESVFREMATVGTDEILVAANDRLRQIKANSEFYEFIAMTDAKGKVIASSVMAINS